VLLCQISLVLLLLLLRGVVVLVWESLHRRSVRRRSYCCSTRGSYRRCGAGLQERAGVNDDIIGNAHFCANTCLRPLLSS
jgi:hypothetical protein